MISEVSIIVPVRDDQARLSILLKKILEQKIKPSELVIIDSSKLSYNFENGVKKSFYDAKIKLIYLHKKPLNPGAARNIGIKNSNCKLIAFLDVKTHPPSNWLEDALRIIESDHRIDGVLGKTVYAACSKFEKRVRAASYGIKPILTIPGSLFKRNVFNIVGFFLTNIVAGEDSDWILRARLHELKIYSCDICLIYSGLHGMKFPNLVKKWWRNYRSCKDIPYLSDHKGIYLLLLNLILIFLTMNWNSLFAHWDESSYLYIRHITKIGIAFACFFYIVYRGFYLPLRRGVLLRYLLPSEWLFVLFISMTIDIIKVFAFFPSPYSLRQRLRYALFRE